jgi:hypothetical protein
MATSPKSLPRNPRPAPQSRKKVPAKSLSSDEKRFLKITMGLLDAMPDEQYQKASEKLNRLITKSRASS